MTASTPRDSGARKKSWGATSASGAVENGPEGVLYYANGTALRTGRHEDRAWHGDPFDDDAIVVVRCRANHQPQAPINQGPANILQVRRMRYILLYLQKK